MTKTVSATTEEVCKYAQHNLDLLVHRRGYVSSLNKWWQSLDEKDQNRISTFVKWVVEGNPINDDSTPAFPRAIRSAAELDKAFGPPEKPEKKRGRNPGALEDVVALLKQKPMSGEELVKATKRSRGSVFPALKELLHRGAVKKRAEGNTVKYIWKEKEAEFTAQRAREILDQHQKNYPDGVDGTRGFVGPVMINGKIVKPKPKIEPSLEVEVVKAPMPKIPLELTFRPITEPPKIIRPPLENPTDKVALTWKVQPAPAPLEKPSTLNPESQKQDMSWKGHTKTCLKCGIDKSPKYIDSKTNICSRCTKASLESQHFCKACKTAKPVSECERFASTPNRKGNLTGWCLECASARDKKADQTEEKPFNIDPEYLRRCLRCMKFVDCSKQPYWIDSCGNCWLPGEATHFFRQWEQDKKYARKK